MLIGNKIFKVAGIFLILLVNSIKSYALLPKDIMESHVHSLEQFLDRFNGREIFPLVDTDVSDKVWATRISLFNFDLKEKSENQDSIKAKVSEFIKDVGDSGIKIEMADPENWLTVDCTFLYNSKNIPMQLCMKMEEFKTDYWRWSISDVVANNELWLPNLEKPIPINPLEHEINFMNLEYDFAKAGDEAYRMKSAGVVIDPLSFFFGLVSAGKLQFKNCNGITFHSRKIPGWEICVSEIKRIESSNSGWLITSIKKTTNQNQSPK